MPRKTTKETLEKLHMLNANEQTEKTLRSILWSMNTGKTAMSRIESKWDSSLYSDYAEWYGEYKTSGGNTWGITVRSEHRCDSKKNKCVMLIETSKRGQTILGPFAAKAVSMMKRNEKIAKKNYVGEPLDENEE